MMDEYDHEEPICCVCRAMVMEPYIICKACSVSAEQGPVTLCLHCFAKGIEFDNHHSDHPYSIVKNNFPVFEHNWTALEELQLIKAVADCGYGNWVDIAHKLRTKSHHECERHYNMCYIDSHRPDMPVFADPIIEVFPRPVVYKLCEDPPRPAEGSLLATEMAGYMAGRGDFMTEHENFMELDLRALEFEADGDEDKLESELKLAVVDVYLRCLGERRRRKRLARKYGLINQRNSRLRGKYDPVINQRMDNLRVFSQLVSPMDFDLYSEAIRYEFELKREISSLQKYRRNHLTRMRHVGVFKMLSKSREQHLHERHLLNDVLNHVKDENACQTWLQRQATLESLGKATAGQLPNAARKSAPPLEISELPGYDQLTYREKELCSHLRLIPAAFLEFKSILVTEANKTGTLRLAQARQLIKIDVNKTRKIFDFLVTEEYIKKE